VDAAALRLQALAPSPNRRREQTMARGNEPGPLEPDRVQKITTS